MMDTFFGMVDATASADRLVEWVPTSTAGANEADAMQAKVLTDDEARRLAANIAKLPALLKREDGGVMGQFEFRRCS